MMGRQVLTLGLSCDERSEAAPGFPERAMQSLCGLYCFHPFNGNPVLFAGDRQTDTRGGEYRINATEAVQQ
ncbi:MAG: hypothetical protein PHY54_06285 [Methylococcales bacterium]|nr:hypothetical protein [Methylococcales bacterium]